MKVPKLKVIFNFYIKTDDLKPLAYHLDFFKKIEILPHPKIGDHEKLIQELSNTS